MKLINIKTTFLHADKLQSFLYVNFNTLGITILYKVMLSLLVGMIKCSQSTQSNQFVISLQYLKEEVRNGVQFFACRESSKFQQVGIILFDGSGQACLKYPKYQFGNILAIY